ncbi:MAG: MgtC/SapB family protein [Terrimicrobiaceae bacterium]|nr:MgtC/SapB family protein [Terrimicrobiaceae bacterium]
MNDLLASLLVSGSLGALIGLERQWEVQVGQHDRRVPAGLRTFTLWALLGAVCAHLSKNGQPCLFVAGLGAVAVWLGIFLYFQSRNKPGAGFTTVATGLLTYLLGGLVVAGEARAALVLTVATLLLLAGKPSLHSISKNFTPEDARMALQFLAVTGAVLPLVPDRDLGPLGAFNPRSIWLMVVIVSGLGFAGYIAVRWFGSSRGMALTGLAGGLASSTATTLGMSRMSRQRPELAEDCTLALVIACTIMLWRVEVLVLAISPPLALAVVPDFLLMSLPGVVFSGFRLCRGSGRTTTSAEYRNPLSLKIALQFGALYAVVVLIVKIASQWFGDTGLLVVSFISGLTDLDAIALSLSNLLQGHQVSAELAIRGIVLAAVANSLLKAGLAASFGDRVLSQKTLLVLGTTGVIGIGSVIIRGFVG